MRDLVEHQDVRYNMESRSRSVQLVARNRKCPKRVNNVLCVIRSCIKMNATIWNHAPIACNLLHEMNNALDC